ncbi:MAG: magnesium-dependent phosphatase-1 [Prolixibacteraceae bacterium]|nr:magnesium-dependent phosphatase-1 [Prolixibacteraceae bacterium]
MNLNLFVFDLDFTLWDAGGTWCDATRPPYTWENGKLRDRDGRWICLYPDVLPVLKELKRKNKRIAAASRTFEPGWALELIQHFNIGSYFDVMEIFPENKVVHFKKIQRYFQMPFSEMVFFDDEYRNIEAVGNLGVETVFVQNGITREMVLKYVD